MGVRSRDMVNGQEKRSAIVTRAQLARSRGWFERGMAGTVLLASYLGTVLTFAGGAEALLNAPGRPLPWLGGLIGQGILTALQWWYKPVSIFHPIYLASFVIDTALTTWGYGWVLAPFLAAWLLSKGVPEPAIVAWGVIALVSGLIAWYPEHTFVD